MQGRVDEGWVSSIFCSERGCDTINEESGAALFSQSRVIGLGILAGSGVLVAMSASAGMGGHHSSETCPNLQTASHLSWVHLLLWVFMHITLWSKGTAKVPRSLTRKDSLLSNAQQMSWWGASMLGSGVSNHQWLGLVGHNWWPNNIVRKKGRTVIGKGCCLLVDIVIVLLMQTWLS